MASFSAIRDGVKSRLETIAGLRAFDYVPDQVPVPCATVGLDTLDYDSTMARGSDRWTVAVRLYVSRASDRAGQDKLDGYLASSGATSVKAAIEGDRTLGGAVHSARVVRAFGYGTYQVGDEQYAGVQFEIDVVAAG